MEKASLTIAGLDPSGGAGIVADIKTFSALGVYGMAVVSALTVQNTLGVSAVEAVSADTVYRQLCAVVTDIRPDAVKIGMLSDTAVIEAVAKVIRQYRLTNIIVDPVMISSSGTPLMPPEAFTAFCNHLLPLATLLTPNIPEADTLAAHGFTIDRLLSAGVSVLLKGGHADGEQKTDTLYTIVNGQRTQQSFTASTVATRNTHGTGCTLSSAIAAYIARGETLPDAVDKAKTYLTHALQAAKDINIGHGHGSLKHFF